MRSQFRVFINKDDLAEKIHEVQPSLIVFGGPREKFSTAELNILRG